MLLDLVDLTKEYRESHSKENESMWEQRKVFISHIIPLYSHILHNFLGGLSSHVSTGRCPYIPSLYLSKAGGRSCSYDGSVPFCYLFSVLRASLSVFFLRMSQYTYIFLLLKLINLYQAAISFSNADVFSRLKNSSFLAIPIKILASLPISLKMDLCFFIFSTWMLYSCQLLNAGLFTTSPITARYKYFPTSEYYG